MNIKRNQNHICNDYVEEYEVSSWGSDKEPRIVKLCSVCDNPVIEEPDYNDALDEEAIRKYEEKHTKNLTK